MRKQIRRMVNHKATFIVISLIMYAAIFTLADLAMESMNIGSKARLKSLVAYGFFAVLFFVLAAYANWNDLRKLSFWFKVKIPACMILWPGTIVVIIINIIRDRIRKPGHYEIGETAEMWIYLGQFFLVLILGSVFLLIAPLEGFNAINSAIVIVLLLYLETTAVGAMVAKEDWLK